MLFPTFDNNREGEDCVRVSGIGISIVSMKDDAHEEGGGGGGNGVILLFWMEISVETVNSSLICGGGRGGGGGGGIAVELQDCLIRSRRNCIGNGDVNDSEAGIRCCRD